MASLLFEETDSEVLVEDELEEVQFSKPKKSKAARQRDEEDERYQEMKRKLEQEIAQKPNVMSKSEPAQEVKKFVSIEIGEEASKEAEAPRKNAQNSVQRPQTREYTTHKEEKKEYEFSPVISPIFGSKEEVKKGVKNKSVSITLPKPKRINPLGTIISPYYGVSELEEFEAEAQEDIERKEKDKHTMLPESETEKQEVQEDINSVSLEDLLMESPMDEEEDLMQISLFGEETPLRESDEERKDIE